MACKALCSVGSLIFHTSQSSNLCKVVIITSVWPIPWECFEMILKYLKNKVASINMETTSIFIKASISSWQLWTWLNDLVTWVESRWSILMSAQVFFSCFDLVFSQCFWFFVLTGLTQSGMTQRGGQFLQAETHFSHLLNLLWPHEFLWDL